MSVETRSGPDAVPSTFIKPSVAGNRSVREGSQLHSIPDSTATTILVVDDESITRKLLSHQLIAAGYNVVTAENGSTALKLVMSDKVDLVLMDVGMPVMDGLTSLRMMRQLHDSSALPVIIMTSSSNDQQIVRCFDAGASDYVTKPVQQTGVVARIESQLKLRKAQQALRESEERYVLASEGTRDGIWDWNLVTGEIYLSPRWLAMVGVKDSSWVPSGISWLELVFEEDRERVRSDLEAHLCGESGHFETELRMPDRDGGFRWMLCRGLAVRNDIGIATRIAGSLTDITEGKVADALTRLPNRTLFHDRVARCVEQFKNNSERRFSILYLDLDDFKLINDSLGHDVGDQFLIQISKRLEGSLRQSEAVLARLGGDEFGILLEGISNANDAMVVAARIQEHLKAPFSISDREIMARISIGVVTVSESNASVEQIIRQADTAMYHAKKSTESHISAFEDRMRKDSAKRLEIGSELKHAIRRDEFSLHYQPIIATNTMRTAGFEALLRWNHPIHGAISPGVFVPIAESNGMIVEIGSWALRQACQQAAQWNMGSDNSIIVSVNVSVRQLAEPQFVEVVKAALDESGVQPNRIKLEVTESLLMQKPNEMIALLQQLQALGVTTGIDDFGTGYSSLAYLHQIPLNVLKIDQSFVQDLAESRKHQAIVRSIIALARSLGLEVIAEGIETAHQASYLHGLQCDYFQGFRYSKAVEVSEATKLIQVDWSQSDRFPQSGLASSDS